MKFPLFYEGIFINGIDRKLHFVKDFSNEVTLRKKKRTQEAKKSVSQANIFKERYKKFL